jgi:hypothetical protein
MPRWLVAGVWKGRYVYDAVEAAPHPLPEVRFTLTVEPGGLCRFRGRVQDDPHQGAPEPGIVRGHVLGNQIRFVKRMPVYYVHSKNGVISLREYVRSEYDLSPDEDVSPPPIWYRGQYCPGTGQVTGRWEIRPQVFDLVCGGLLYPWGAPLTTGSWDMVRDPEQRP